MQDKQISPLEKIIQEGGLLFSNPPITSENEMQFLESCVYLLSMNWYLNQYTERPLTAKHCQIIALYMKYGKYYEKEGKRYIKIDRELKDKVNEVLNYNSRSLDSHNQKMRDLGYLFKDEWNNDINRLHGLFTNLKDEIDRSKTGATMLFRFNVQR